MQHDVILIQSIFRRKEKMKVMEKYFHIEECATCPLNFMNGTAKDTLVVYRLSKLVKKRVRPPVGESIVSESIAKYGPSNCGDSLRKLSGELWDKLNDDKLERASKKRKIPYNIACF
jgi:hypothetical protein